MNPYDVGNDPMFKKFFKHLLTPEEIMKSDKQSALPRKCPSCGGMGCSTPCEYGDDEGNDLKDKIASYVIDYPRFEESANEVADLILEAVREHDKQQTPGCNFCGEKEIWDERLNLCHSCAKEHYV